MSIRIVKRWNVAVALLSAASCASGCAETEELESFATAEEAIAGCYTDGNPSTPDPNGQGDWCPSRPPVESDLEMVKGDFPGTLPVCRAKAKGVWLGGLIREGKCRIFANNGTIYNYTMPNTYAHYMIDENMQHHAWVTLSRSNILPGNSVITGIDSNGVPYYLCETLVDGSWYPGKWANNRCYVVFRNDRAWSTSTSDSAVRILIRY